jgi:hypothetical protein
MKVGDKVQCTYYEQYEPNSPMRGRFGTIIELKKKVGGMGDGWCHLVKWDDGEEATQYEDFLHLVTPLDELL